MLLLPSRRYFAYFIAAMTLRDILLLITIIAEVPAL